MWFNPKHLLVQQFILLPVSYKNLTSFFLFRDFFSDIENLEKALRDTKYGQCVYELDNNVCDHQVVNMEFQNGATASFTMVAFTEAICERKVLSNFPINTSQHCIRIVGMLNRSKSDRAAQLQYNIE